ncbi:FAD/NAD(P)-binding domain-containing protein [Coniochaeta ligniaria NRRL 30616]|uniref:FAD/NAD(P)-binding domain-containing protein n=1 Tax=Coniochaeta ligniaria NRRL 30616 TaxID=1408157 RepID=A0A1J7JCL2_9PEZI|nr:FAD/NAD(P)-binding domain-containing protein [Coniochaeta ligniaria NRRL 30616]
MAVQEKVEIAEYDVVIVGGGPVGLLVAYQLKRFGVSVCVLEQHDKNTQDAYGRAIALFPRTTEQLDQLDLIEPMLQLGFACRSSVTYKNGERVIPGRVWTFMESIKDTTYDFTLVLRQMHTEAILREKIASVGASYHQSVECVDFQVDASAPLDAPGVTSTFTNRKTQRTFKLKSKYLIGADGGRSFVRRHAAIPFDGDTSEDRWIRIDGIVETDMPINRAYGAIESRTHGNVLWAPLDNGATRIGYAFSPEIAAKYPDGVTQEVALKEAIECMKPFKVEFKEVHWWTLYTIGQRIARSFSTEDRRIFLCGDAAHTHSSGAAQGLNTGIHDAVNLGWKLALQIRGIAKDEVLDTYSAERLTAVQQLINYDKDIAMLMSHKWPAWYTGDPSADPYLALGELFEKAAPFNTGLGITYPANLLNQTGSSTLAVAPGSRPPDVELTMPGINRPVRLQRVTVNFAKFFVVVFTGDINSTRSSIQELERYLSEKGKDLKKHSAIGWITISPVTGCSPFEALGTRPLGDTYYDPTSLAHEKFGIDTEKGNVVILRPDGLVGSGGAISGPWIREYFSQVLKL